MSKIKVHVLNFHGIFSHIEILLEDTSKKNLGFYNINRWSDPDKSWSKYGFDGFMEAAGSTYSFDIEADPKSIVDDWVSYYYRTANSASVLGENCAVATEKFLTHFANIPKASSSNTSWNLLALGIMWPSFIPCPITLPGRIMDNVKFHTKGLRFATMEDLPIEHKNKYINAAIQLIKQPEQNMGASQKIRLARLNALTNFYGTLENISQHADKLAKRGHADAAKCARDLIKNLENNASNYLTSASVAAYQQFKKDCDKAIKIAKPTLEKHRGWKQLLGNIALAVVGVGAIYLLAACINKAVTGNFLFFKTRSIEKITATKDAISLCAEKDEAINATPLTTIGGKVK